MNNMNGKTFLIIACLLTWLVAGPSLAQSRAPGYVDKRLGVSFTPPPNWKRDAGQADDGQIVKYSASRLDESTPPSFIYVSARPAKDKMRLQDLLLVHLVIERGDPTHQIVGVAPTKVGDKDAISIATIAPSNDLRVRIRWVYVLHGGKYLCFNLSAFEEDFPAKARAFEKMMSTVRWSPPKR